MKKHFKKTVRRLLRAVIKIQKYPVRDMYTSQPETAYRVSIFGIYHKTYYEPKTTTV